MAELEFHNNKREGLIVVFRGHRHVATIAEHKPSENSGDGGWCAESSAFYALTADELDQIAAKLRSLNGDPNTRSTDERVVELRDAIERNLGRDESIAAEFGNDFASGLAAAYRKVFDAIKELFPTCKPSEEEVNG